MNIAIWIVGGLDMLALVCLMIAGLSPEPEYVELINPDRNSVEYKKYRHYSLMWGYTGMFGFWGTFVLTIALFVLALAK